MWSQPAPSPPIPETEVLVGSKLRLAFDLAGGTVSGTGTNAAAVRSEHMYDHKQSPPVYLGDCRMSRTYTITYEGTYDPSSRTLSGTESGFVTVKATQPSAYPEGASKKSVKCGQLGYTTVVETTNWTAEVSANSKTFKGAVRDVNFEMAFNGTIAKAP